MSLLPHKKAPVAETTEALENTNFTGQKAESSDTPGQAVGGKSFTFPRPIVAGDERDYSLGFPDRFPIQALPASLREIVEQLAAVYQTPICMPAMAALAVVSAAVGKSVVVKGGYKDKQTRLNLYMIAAAERGSGKGNIGETLARPLHERGTAVAEKHRDKISSLRGEVGLLKSEIARLERDSGKAKSTPRAETEDLLTKKHLRLEEIDRDSKRDVTLMISDSSSEALARCLADNHETLFSCSSEAGGALKIALGKYTDDKGDFELLLNGYSGDFVASARITRAKVELKEPCLTLFWLVQPILLRQLCGDDEAFSRGLTARPLIFDSEARREFDNREVVEFTHADQWATLLGGILDARFLDQTAPPRFIQASKEARDVFSDLHDESVRLEQEKFADLKGELSRWRENAIKVAGLFALIEETDELTADHARRGVEIVRWAAYNYLSLLQSGRRQRQQDRSKSILGHIDDAGGAIHVGDLAKRHGINRSSLDAVMAACPGVIEIVKRPQPKGQAGQPAQIVRRATGKSTQSSESPSLANSLDSIDSPQPNPAEPPAPHA
jgi:hypothetical protein